MSPRTPNDHPQRTPRQERYLTLAQFCQQFEIARSTFYDWRAKSRAPRRVKLPNGDLRISETDLNRWLDDLGDAA
ncbi:helix-turn-helix transcriptional regulator [Streptacidiphilus fuscans]|uniref:Helix-turn-helix domain-containing protein n=1 Tax=Streptacidiphilus fuscans TaxID=2789292 RepID=A0A931B568_9ACTN|nr:helix-turn-helix domain-containing protein [Streptacidiphilus fuscans]MBF9070483.1 helix-turn-helix domain-containing protein [Streptacidiphilus fuscans]